MGIDLTRRAAGFVRSRWKIGLILIAAAILRLRLFCGFGLGDDISYIDLAREILARGYPAVENWTVFTFRPVWVLSFVGGVRVMGLNDAGLVLSTLLSSLLGIALAYEIGRRWWDEAHGLMAAALVLSCPLDAVQATTMTNDIMVSTWIAAGILAATAGTGAGGIALGTGLCFLLAVGTKPNAMILPAVLGSWLVLTEARRESKWGIAGCIAALVLTAVALGLTTGDPLRNFSVERDYYDRNASPQIASGTVPYALIFSHYPRALLGLAAGDLWSNFDTGLLVPGAFLLSFAAWRRGGTRGRCAALWLLTALVMMQFSPMRLWPRYIPIHRLVRFIAVAIIPSALVLAWGLGALRVRHPRWAALALAAIVAVGLARARVKSDVFVSAMEDMRAAAAVLEKIPGRAIVYTDQEAAIELRYLTNFRPDLEIRSLDEDSDVIAPGFRVSGGSRRIEALADRGRLASESGVLLWSKKTGMARWRDLAPVTLRRVNAALAGRPLVRIVPGRIDRTIPELAVDSVAINGDETHLYFDVWLKRMPPAEPFQRAWTYVFMLDADGDSSTGIIAPSFGGEYHVRARFDQEKWFCTIDQDNRLPPATETGARAIVGAVSGNLLRMRVSRRALGSGERFLLTFAAFCETDRGHYEPWSFRDFGEWPIDLSRPEGEAGVAGPRRRH